MSRPTNDVTRPTNDDSLALPIGSRLESGHKAGVGILITFLLGVGNFALHRAALESRHPMLVRAQWQWPSPLGRMSMAFEFVLLLSALLLVAGGRTGWGIAYAVYSALNATTVWLIVSRRI